MMNYTKKIFRSRNEFVADIHEIDRDEKSRRLAYAFQRGSILEIGSRNIC
jgi:hypothetical protein